MYTQEYAEKERGRSYYVTDSALGFSVIVEFHYDTQDHQDGAHWPNDLKSSITWNIAQPGFETNRKKNTKDHDSNC